MQTERASPVFTLTVLVTVGLAGLIGLMVLMMQVRPGFMGMAHFTERHHRVHDVTFGLLIATAVVGMFAQLRTPSKNVAGQLMALIPWAALGLISILTSSPIRFAPFPLFAALTLLATALHPRRSEMFRVFRAPHVNRVLLVLVVVAAIPLLAVALRNVGLQRTLTNDHATLGHYGFMAAYCVTSIAAGLLASLRPDGWRLAAWTSGLLPIVLGAASLMYPSVDSSLGLAWASAAIAWGVTFVTTAELTRSGEARAQVAVSRASADSNPVAFGENVVKGDRQPTGAPRWVYAVALIVVVLVAVLFIVLHVAGGGFRGHGPT